MKFSDKVFYLRAKKKLTQIELAEKVHVKQSTIQAYESGRAKPMTNTAIQLAKVLGVSHEELVNDEANIIENR